MGYESEKSWVRLVTRRVDDYKGIENERIMSVFSNGRVRSMFSNERVSKEKE